MTDRRNGIIGPGAPEGGVTNLDIQTVIITSSNHTLVVDDLNKTIRFDTGGVDRVLTIPVSILTEGKWIEVKRRGSGEVTITRDSITFNGPIGTSPGNVDFKINGTFGFSVFLEGTEVKTGSAIINLCYFVLNVLLF